MGFILGVLFVIGVGAAVVSFLSTRAGEGCCMGGVALIMLFVIGVMVLFFGALAFGCMAAMF